MKTPFCRLRQKISDRGVTSNRRISCRITYTLSLRESFYHQSGHVALNRTVFIRLELVSLLFNGFRPLGRSTRQHVSLSHNAWYSDCMVSIPWFLSAWFKAFFRCLLVLRRHGNNRSQFIHFELSRKHSRGTKHNLSNPVHSVLRTQANEGDKANTRKLWQRSSLFTFTRWIIRSGIAIARQMSQKDHTWMHSFNRGDSFVSFVYFCWFWWC